MHRLTWSTKIILLSVAYAVLAATGTIGTPASNTDQWYPASAAPYPGTQFHCIVPALKPDEPGIKNEDKVFVDHCLAIVLKCAQEKEMMLTKLQQGKAKSYFPTYAKVTNAQLARLKTVQPPQGLEQFKSDLINSIKLQLKFFSKAVEAQAKGTSIENIMNIPEGRQAAGLLMDAWGVMDRRYFWFWSGPSKESIYHHLCAFDLF